MDIDPETIDSAAAAIERYLAEHPGSADTVEGVAEWWLARQRVRESLDVVSEALERLSASGTVRECRSADGRVIYKLVDANAAGERVVVDPPRRVAGDPLDAGTRPRR